MASVLRLALCAAICVCAASARAAFSDPSQIQTEAYIHLVQGDHSLDIGRLDEALEHYTLARDFYLQIAEEFPDYKPRVVTYRADYCSDQIDLLVLRLGNEPNLALTSPPPPKPARPPVSKEEKAEKKTSPKKDLVEEPAPPPAPQKLAPEPPAPVEPPAPIEPPAPPAPDPEILSQLRDQIAALSAERDDLSARLDELVAQNLDLAAQLNEARARADRAEDALQHLPPPPPPAPTPSIPDAPSLAPDASDWPQILADLHTLLLSGEPAAALGGLDALPSPPDEFSLPVALLRSSALVRLGQGSSAVDTLAPFADVYGEDPDFHVAFGNALLSAGRLSEARDSLLRATKLSKDLPPEAYANLALLYAASSPKNLRSARKYYQNALDLGLPPVPSLAALLD